MGAKRRRAYCLRVRGALYMGMLQFAIRGLFYLCVFFVLIWAFIFLVGASVWAALAPAFG